MTRTHTGTNRRVIMEAHPVFLFRHAGFHRSSESSEAWWSSWWSSWWRPSLSRWTWRRCLSSPSPWSKSSASTVSCWTSPANVVTMAVNNRVSTSQLDVLKTPNIIQLFHQSVNDMVAGGAGVDGRLLSHWNPSSNQLCREDEPGPVGKSPSLLQVFACLFVFVIFFGIQPIIIEHQQCPQCKLGLLQWLPLPFWSTLGWS